ncbi:hypothetical protein EXIGLDRAFT_768666 [Exidia glandulosa HHB12029]|uniref:Uncharacterized protein n=1 Tax=Exidia glandulosa HHB12029 TaxID=1314781 RepID=A0A165I106_EXIGL|nr:hypothetical protein EXIGLDRAFT_768666 [Exidia glandulosa HHB12029]
MSLYPVVCGIVALPFMAILVMLPISRVCPAWINVRIAAVVCTFFAAFIEHEDRDFAARYRELIASMRPPETDLDSEMRQWYERVVLVALDGAEEILNADVPYLEDFWKGARLRWRIAWLVETTYINFVDDRELEELKERHSETSLNCKTAGSAEVVQGLEKSVEL